MANLQKALSLLIKAGFIVNWEKSSLIPTTNFTFLGMLWDSVEGTLSLAQNKLLQLHTPPGTLHEAVPLLRLKGRFIRSRIFRGW
jgi:hypothetical protein